MSKEICDICGNEFVWKKGMAYCSYDCEQKARQNLKQQAEKYQEKIKKETQCPACGFVGVDIEQWCNDDHGLYWETFFKCQKCGRKTKDTEWHVYKEPTVFETITASPEVLAEKLVFVIRCEADPSLAGWTSHVVQSVFETREKAIAATVAELNSPATTESKVNNGSRENLPAIP